MREKLLLKETLAAFDGVCLRLPTAPCQPSSYCFINSKSCTKMLTTIQSKVSKQCKQRIYCMLNFKKGTDIFLRQS